MTALKGTQAKLLVDEFDFSNDTSSIDVNATMGAQDTPHLQSTAMTSVAILPSLKIEQNGYVRDAGNAGDLEQELSSRLGVAGSYVAALLGTDTAACAAWVLDGTFGQSMQFSAPVAGLLTLNGAWGMGSGAHRGLRVYEGALSATGAQTAYDFGAAGSAGGHAFLFVQSITGSATDAVILVESSATEGGTYATEATFTFSAVGGSKQSMSGTVNRWLRLNVDDLGGADAFTVVLVVCVAGVTE